jgi:hypothetical protein
MDKEEKSSTSEKTASHQALTLLSEVLMESLVEQNEEPLEAFEHYSHALRLRVHQSEHDFFHQVTQGYDVILEELKTKKGDPRRRP